jgi:putative heme-binding domain-containing protein
MPRSFLPFTTFLAVAFACAAPVFAADKKEAAPLTAEEILKKVTWPKDQFDATVFASPPQVSYPIFISVAPDGTAFIGCDPNGSLDRKPGLGKVVMARDTNGDGKADKFTDFAKIDSPRGVAWDGATRTLYVMHPPFLTAYHDDNGDGVSDRQEDLITGLGFGLDFRGADHTINGIRIGIDGWIYIACGDYGAVKATGKDGRSLAMRGGGIVRIRPDGTGFERVVWGTRNILAVAISPTMELFTRDNTNDGDKWNDRLSFNPFGAHMGYPTLFLNFADETIPTMMDFGGGSPVGSIFIDEPTLPKDWAYGFYSVEWGRSEIDLHKLSQTGAAWKLDDTKQFMKMPRATDLDVDGAGHLYAVSWDGATFTYNGPNVGYIVRLTAKDVKPMTVPDLKKAANAQLVQTIGSPSGVWRFSAQRELLARRASLKQDIVPGLEQIVTTSQNMGARVAAIYTLKQLLGAQSTPLLVAFAKKDDLREYALKALADDQRVAAQVPVQPFVEALADKNPRVRLQAVYGLGHLGKTEAAEAMLAHTVDEDYTVAHVAVRALATLKAGDVCLRALDSSDAKVQGGALRVLQAIYEPAVVDGLISRAATSNAELRRGILRTLCRLDTQEAPYTDPKMWWGTRPDTSGPLYKPERWAESDKIEAALKKALDTAKDQEARTLVADMYRMKVNFPGLIELMLAKAGSDTAAKLTAIEGMFNTRNELAPEALGALRDVAVNEKENPELRAKALRLVQRASEHSAALDTAVAAFAPLAGHDLPAPALTAAFEDFTRDTKNTKHIGAMARLAGEGDVAKRTLAQTVLVNLASSNLVKGKDHDNAAAAVEKSWAKPDTAASLLHVIARTGAKNYADQVKAKLKDPNNAVAESALAAFQKLGLSNEGAPGGKTIGAMKYEEVFAAVQKGGDAAQGKDMFLRAGCIACHTTRADEPPKGPMLAAVAKTYDRAALTESILKPNAKIAQGFETQWFKTKKGEQIEGFVTREGGDSVDVRNIASQTVTLEKADITERGKRETSMMPEGLLNSFTPADLSNLLAFLESLKAK